MKGIFFIMGLKIFDIIFKNLSLLFFSYILCKWYDFKVFLGFLIFYLICCWGRLDWIIFYGLFWCVYSVEIGSSMVERV